MKFDQSIRVAVVNGGHSFNVVEFHDLFGRLSGIQAYIQHMDDFATSSLRVRNNYDVILFYTMLLDGPTDDGLEWYQGKPKSVLENLGQTDQGIFILHHSILAYRNWPIWGEIVGFDDLTHDVAMNQEISVQVTSPRHPITSGLSDWQMADETCNMKIPLPDSEILLTTDHPKSMKVLAWVRRYQKSRVFCFQSGHDSQAWQNQNFVTVLQRGIQWCAKKI